MHPGSSDYATSYYNHPPHLPPHHQNPNPTDFISNTPNPNHHPSFASAPPFSQSHQTPPEFSSYSPYLPNPEIAPTAPSFSHQPPPSFPQLNPPPFISAGSDPPFYAYDHPPPPTNYTPPPAASPSLIPNSNVNTPFYPNSYPHLNPPVAPVYEPVYENVKYDHLGTYPNDNSSRYGQATHGPTRSSFDRNDDGLEEGVYAYDGGRLEPYGARGTGGGSKTSNWAAFDDYGRSTANSYSAKNEHVGSGKMVRAVPKSEAQMDVMNGVQKFRVKLLPESSGQNTMDVLCQIGLDGIRMLEPNTNKTLRIYPLETLTRWEVTEPSIYAFWSKTSVDIEPRRIRLQSNSYTTSTILDTVTAATVQFKEMGGKDSLRGKGSFDAGKLSDPPMEKKKGFTDWVNLIKPGNEEKDHWVPDEAVTKCTSCGTDFGAFVRKHHCRNCGEIFCDKCTQGRIALTAEESAQPVRVCDQCMAEVSHRLSNAKETVGKSTGLTSHDDLARKLQEEMDRNRKTSSGSKPDGSGKRMREVACPTCTVHLQVQVPSSGSETIECGVCQHPFLVSAH